MGRSRVICANYVAPANMILDISVALAPLGLVSSVEVGYLRFCNAFRDSECDADGRHPKLSMLLPSDTTTHIITFALT